MDLNKKQLIDITKITYIENFVSFKEILDFNKLVFFLDRLEPNIVQHPHKIKLNFFDLLPEGKQIQETIKECFSYNNEKMNTCLFASLTKQGGTESHMDEETVFLIPTIGQIVYNIYNKHSYESYFLKPGDLLVIPKQIMHAAIPICPRITISVGIFN